ncbi:MAG: hypothetical protein ACE5KM_06855 [Planctomycetaceae bacterium]
MESGVRLSVFAVDPGTIITLVIVVISFIGWIINLVNEKSKQNAPRPAPPRRGVRDDRFEQDIDVFLQQVGGRRAAWQDEVAVEVVPESELLERQAEERRGRKLSSIEDRHVETSRLGEGVRSHVETHMRGALDAPGKRDAGSRIEAVVEADFGKSIAAQAEPPPRQRAAVEPDEIVRMLRDPEGVRKAIILNEVLTRRARR